MPNDPFHPAGPSAARSPAAGKTGSATVQRLNQPGNPPSGAPAVYRPAAILRPAAPAVFHPAAIQRKAAPPVYRPQAAQKPQTRLPLSIPAPPRIQPAFAILRKPAAAVTRGSAVIQRAHSYKFGVSSSAMDTQQWTKSADATFGSLTWQPQSGFASPMTIALVKSNQSVTHGKEHAEDVALRVIDNLIGGFDHTIREKLLLSISKSPCTSTARPKAGGGMLPVTSGKPVGCTEELINLVTNGINHNGHNYTFSLHLICRGLYCPTVGGSSQSDVLDASEAAIAAMRATGFITVTGDERPAPSANRYEVN